MRDSFSSELVKAVKGNDKIYLLSGDHGYALFDAIRRECPDHFINAGVAEQNMIGVAAGLSKSGLIPVCYGLSAFLPIRVLEQIKLDFCYENLPGIFIGDGAGMVYSHLGSSHQSFEDIACLRALPNMTILSPADRYEFEMCFAFALKSKSPVYIRMGKADIGLIHNQPPATVLKPLLVKTGNANVGFIATGSMVKVACDISAKSFPDKNIPVWSMPCLKPVDKNDILDIFSKFEQVYCFEEHNIYGGLASVIAEIMAEGSKTAVVSLGIQDRFSERCGTYQYLMTEHGLDQPTLSKKIQGTMV